MAQAARLRSALAEVWPLAAVAAALLVPVAPARPPASQSPSQAAQRAEGELPLLGVIWGRMRGWERVGDGWTIVWQPSHGAWLVRAWVPDAPAGVRWRLDAAPWLPGARLTRRAAALLASRTTGEAAVSEAAASECLARRDWFIGDRRLLGALPAGSDVPSPSRPSQWPWEALLAGSLLAGALVRRLAIAEVSLPWRRAALVAGGGAALALPFATGLAARGFSVGVRPWVTELAYVAAGVTVLGALAVAAIRFPVAAGRTAPGILAVALGAGLLAGRLAPQIWFLEVAGLRVHLALWAAVAVLGGWLLALAGDGLRELLAPLGVLRPWLLVVLAVLAVLRMGVWLGPSIAVLAGAGSRRTSAPGIAPAITWGWLAGCVLASAGWWGPLRDALVMLVAGSAALAVALLRGRR